MYVYEKDGKLNMIFGKEGSLQIPAGSVLTDGTKLYGNEDETYNLTAATPEITLGKDVEAQKIIATIGDETIEGNIPVEPEPPAPVTVESIAWTTPPTKVTYTTAETLDLTGAVITATMSDKTTEVVTDSCTFSPANGAALTVDITKVTATYEGKTAEQAITVEPENSENPENPVEPADPVEP